MSSAVENEKLGPERADTELPGVSRACGPPVIVPGFSSTTASSAHRARRGPQGPAVELYLQLCRLSDTGLALSALLGLFVFDNLGRLPKGLDGFLGARVTVKNVLLVLVFVACWHLCCRWVGLYDWGRVNRRLVEATRVCIGACAGTGAAVIFPLLSESGSFRADLLVPFFALSTLLMLVFRWTLRWATTARAGGARNVLIVGTGPRAQELYSALRAGVNGGIRLMGFVDTVVHSSSCDTSLVCSLDGLEAFLMTQQVDEVLITLPIKSCYAEIQRTIEICERVGVPVRYSARLFSHARIEPRVEHTLSGPVLAVPAAADGPRMLVKRAMDLVVASLALVLVAPVLVAVAVLVKLTSAGPVLFAQWRYGRGRRRFKMYKFRTMVEGAETLQPQLELLNEAKGPVFKIRRDPRITSLGAFLRRTSLDELPQLWNVLRGDMSLVGPRPLPLRDVKNFGHPWLMRRFSVLPGITGLWQVSGRSSLGFDEWIQLDLEYIDHWSLWLDLSILTRTLPAVLSGRGAS